jgi:hypothetical protein
MQLRIDRQGRVRCLHDEMIDLSCLGAPVIQRASPVEPDLEGKW